MNQHASSLITAPRTGSKQARLVSMLSARKAGTIEKVSKAMGWPPYSTRASLTGRRKRGDQIERREHKPALYSIRQERS